MAGMQEEGIPVFMELDDNYRVPPPFEQISMWVNKRADRPLIVAQSRWGLPDKPIGYDDAHCYETCTDIVKFCDGLIVSTPKLADVYRDLNRNIHVCPNSIDPGDWPDPPPSADVLRVGWAASDSHVFDAELIRDALYWASTQKNVEVVIMGIHPELTKLRFPHTHVHWANDVADYRRNVGMIDVMLCPIISSEWSDAKSDVKALEAAMGGACSIMSDVPPYSTWKEKPGYFARHPWEFRRLVRHLCRYPDEARETARLAREYVLSERMIQEHVVKWREAIASV